MGLLVGGVLSPRMGFCTAAEIEVEVIVIGNLGSEEMNWRYREERRAAEARYEERSIEKDEEA